MKIHDDEDQHDAGGRQRGVLILAFHKQGFQKGVEEGSTLVLINTSPIHTALYSLLNRLYDPLQTAQGLEASVTIAVGGGVMSRQVRVHPRGRIIVVAEAA